MENKSILRSKLVPILATLAMLAFWWQFSEYRSGPYLWWIIAIIAILVGHYSILAKNKKTLSE